MLTPLSRYIAFLRQRRQVTQVALARLVGVSRDAISRWEIGDRGVPEKHQAALAAALGLSVEGLRNLQDLALRARRLGFVPPSTPVLEAPQFDVSRSPLQTMLALGNTAGGLHQRSQILLGGDLYQYLLDTFPRETPHELMILHHATANSAWLAWLSLRQVGCQMLIVRPDGPYHYRGDLFQPALAWQSEEEQLILFGQVTIAVVSQSRRYRVDFLLRYQRVGGRVHWFHVEMDGGYHKETCSQDARRAHGIGSTEIRFENRVVLRPDFFENRLLREVRGRAAWLERTAAA